MNISPRTSRHFLSKFQLPKNSSQEGRTAETSELDRVVLNNAENREFRAAGFLNRAAGEYLSLVQTHPSEFSEFHHGLGEVQDVVGEILYGGRWPEDSEIPALPRQPHPGQPSENGGLTRSEQLASSDLVELYRSTAPSVKNPAQHAKLASAIHLLQSGLQGRVLRRDYPNYWLSSPGSLQQDAQREEKRWGLSAQ